jgi:hypothetical protein
MTAPQLRKTVWAVLVFFFVIGLGVLAGGMRVWILAQRSTAWPRITGQVASIEETSHLAKGGSISGVTVLYNYIFDGQSHQGHRVAFGLHTESLRQQLRQMRKGDSIKISVDPRDASACVMFPGVTTATRIPAFVGLFVIGFTVLIALLLYRDPPWKVSS